MATTVSASTMGQKSDTVNVALITTHGRFDRAERRKLAEYLETRLRLADVKVVDM